jgi:hypothetical protein
MQRTLLTLAVIGLVCFLLIVRLFFRQHNRMTDEREWFAKALQYEFSATVDSIAMYNKNSGRFYATITDGNPRLEREDSLKKLFKQHDMLYLIYKRSANSIVFIVPDVHDAAKGDSMRVSSENNIVRFFRDGKEVSSSPLTKTLTGYGRPWFLKKN